MTEEEKAQVHGLALAILIILGTLAAVIGHSIVTYTSVGYGNTGTVYGATMGKIGGCEVQAMHAPACWIGYRN